MRVLSSPGLLLVGRTSTAVGIAFAIVMAALPLVAMERVASAQGGPPPASVWVDAARLEHVQEQRLVTGELRPLRRARVATQEEGLVTNVAVEEGQIVKQGETLATLDSTGLQIDLQDVEAQEQVAIASAKQFEEELKWRERDLEMYRSLATRGAGNLKEINDAESQALIARSKFMAAQHQAAVIHARAERLRKRIADTTIVAPFDGAVVAKLIEQGNWAEQGATIVELVSTGPIDAWLVVSQDYADAIFSKQLNVTIHVQALNRTFESTQTRVVPQVDSQVRTFPMSVRLKNEDGTLASGMSVTGWLPTGDASDQLTIAKDGVLRNDAGAFVYVARSSASAGGPAVAAVASVQVLYALTDRFVIRSSSIQPGDLIVVEGNERLFPNMPVTPIGLREPSSSEYRTPSSEPGQHETRNSQAGAAGQ